MAARYISCPGKSKSSPMFISGMIKSMQSAWKDQKLWACPNEVFVITVQAFQKIWEDFRVGSLDDTFNVFDDGGIPNISSLSIIW